MKYSHLTIIMAGYVNRRHRKVENIFSPIRDIVALSGVSVACVLVTFLLIAYQPASFAATVFADDFESGTLDNWTIGGRQLAGPNIADVVSRHGSLMGHLYKNSFTEITFGRSFAYEADLQFNFDMETRVTSQSPPSPNYYGSASADFIFRDVDGNNLGSVWYASATTSYIFTVFDADPTRDVVQITGSGLQNYSLDVTEMLSLIGIDETTIDEVFVQFRAYSSTYPYPAVSAELWVDNFNTNPVPLPASLYLFGTGILGSIGISRRKKAANSA